MTSRIHLDHTPDLDERRFMTLWALAALTYGAGDVLTTLAITVHPTVTEANALLQSLMTMFGESGLVMLKLAVFAGCIALCLQPFSQDRDPFLVLAPPVILSIVGAFLTTYNIVLLMH